jgi:hypothetical protein
MMTRPAVAAAVLAAAVSAPASSTIITVSPGQSIADAVAGAVAGDDIQVAAGTYTNDFPIVSVPLTIEAVPNGANSGPVILDATVPPPNLKGIITTTAGLTVNGLTFEGAAISAADGGNGAGIRDQIPDASSLIVENSRFIGNQEGILTGGSGGQEHVQVLGSQFINNGNPDPAVFQHALYVNDAASLEVSGSLFCGQLIGHDIKSRALATTVSNSQIFIGSNAGAPAGCNVGTTSIGIDLPNGGVGDLVADTLIQGPANQNGAMVSFGEEGLVSADNSLAISDSTFISTANGLAIQERPTCVAVVQSSNNIFTGVSAIINQPNCIIESGDGGGGGDGPITGAPEPASLALLGSGLFGLVVWRRQRNQRRPRSAIRAP